MFLFRTSILNFFLISCVLPQSPIPKIQTIVYIFHTEKNICIFQMRNFQKISLIVLGLVVLYFLFTVVRRRVSLLSTDDIINLETIEEKKEAITAFLDANKLKLKDSKFNIVARFNVITQDKAVLQNVMDASKASDYNKLMEILNS